jgi:hypothetical protein
LAALERAYLAEPNSDQVRVVGSTVFLPYLVYGDALMGSPNYVTAADAFDAQL